MGVTWWIVGVHGCKKVYCKFNIRVEYGGVEHGVENIGLEISVVEYSLYRTNSGIYIIAE